MNTRDVYWKTGVDRHIPGKCSHVSKLINVFCIYKWNLHFLLTFRNSKWLFYEASHSIIVFMKLYGLRVSRVCSKSISFLVSLVSEESVLQTCSLASLALCIATTTKPPWHTHTHRSSSPHVDCNSLLCADRSSTVWFVNVKKHLSKPQVCPKPLHNSYMS